jgi:fermentation-respiration switch protein FrsA (DUF1100 family)
MFAATIILGSAIFVFALRRLEFAITFHPVRIDASEHVLPPRGAEDVWFTTVDNRRLHGWFFASAKKPATATVIFFHGNGGNISNVAWVGERLAVRGFNVLLSDYRGYGQSEGDLGDERDLYADGDAAFAYVVSERSIAPETIVLYGQSLGTTVVADIAARRRCAAVIMESGLSSASAMAANSLPWLPRSLHFLGRNRFESARKLASVRVPVLISHGDPDPVIPTSEGRALFAAANEPKALLIFPGAGHNVFGSKGDEYLNLIENFIRDSLKN